VEQVSGVRVQHRGPRRGHQGRKATHSGTLDHCIEPVLAVVKSVERTEIEVAN
jgi:hypothetical protein